MIEKTPAEALQAILDFPNDGRHTLIKCLTAIGNGRTMYFSGLGIGDLKIGKFEDEPPGWRRFYDRLAALGGGLRRKPHSGESTGRRFSSSEALRYGPPPLVGFAMGSTAWSPSTSGKESIRHVIAFPKTTSAWCPLMRGHPLRSIRNSSNDLKIAVVTKEPEGNSEHMRAD